MFGWKYIDRRQFTISAMQDFNSMKAILDKTPERIKNKVDEDAITIQNENGRYIEKSWCHQNSKSLKELDLSNKRYKDAIVYMEWFLPAWDTLKEQKKTILREYYMSESRKSGASIRLQHELNYSERHIDRLRAEALDEFANLLLGA